MKCAAILFLLLAAVIVAQDKPVVPLTSDEELTYLAAQKEALVALDALKSTAEYQRAMAAQAVVQELRAKAYADRKLAPQDALWCDGPSAGPCEKVPSGRVRLIEQPKPPGPKPEGKK